MHNVEIFINTIKTDKSVCRTVVHEWSLVWPGGLVGFKLHSWLRADAFFTTMTGASNWVCSQSPPITDEQLGPELLKQLTLSPEDTELSTKTQYIKTSC